MERAMNILYCGDENIRDGVLVSTLSLLMNQRAPLRIYLATAATRSATRSFRPVDGAFAARLDTLVRTERPGSSVTLADATAVMASEPPRANMETRFTPLCMLRLYADRIPELEGLGRVLYLDNDVLCHGDVAALYGQDMDGAEIGGVLDRYGSWVFHHKLRYADYLNSGVLLMNMDRIRELDLLGRCRNLCARERMFMPDQTALNKLAAKKFFFPRRFNEQGDLRGDTVLQHFTTRLTLRGTLTVKPWDVERVHSVLGLHEYDDVFDRYLQLRGAFGLLPKERRAA